MAKRRRLTPAQMMPDAEAAPPAPIPPAATAASALAARPGLGTAPIARVAGETAAVAALQEVAAALDSARSEGRLVQRLPLEAVDTAYLVRDRIETDEEALGQLIHSLRSHGQRTPIEVADLGAGRYGLISGWRRVTALRRLQAETGAPRFATVLALMRRPETAEAAYVAMVEENEVRLGLSYYERARIAARAADLGVFATERQALQRLFASASRARRSKIGSFLGVYRALDTVLRFPQALPERLGLRLAQHLAQDPGAAARIAADLAARPAAQAAEEQARLAALLAPAGPMPAGPVPAAPPPRGDELRPGLFLTEGPGPALTLSGPALDPALRARLRDWLRAG